jgi:hypothetical protein
MPAVKQPGTTEGFRGRRAADQRDHVRHAGPVERDRIDGLVRRSHPVPGGPARHHGGQVRRRHQRRPHNWTSFKEFDVAFAPNYTGNVITLTPAFFAEVNDGSRVTLTFHFWSGATVTYSVIRSGGSVTGTTT